MSRYKFRAFHKGGMIDNCAVINGMLAIEEDPVNSEPLVDSEGIHHYSDWAKYNAYPESPVMQWTGLTDCNCIDIYESDVVYLAGYGDYLVDFPFIQLYEAKYEGDIGKIKGNIHANPELMENNK